MEANNKFDDLLRESLRPQGGLSGWFTRKVMMQIEQQKSLTEQKKLTRIGFIVAMCSLIICGGLFGMMYWMTQDGSATIYLLDYLKAYITAVICGWLIPIYYTISSIPPVQLLAVVVGISALICWDTALNKGKKHHA